MGESGLGPVTNYSILNPGSQKSRGLNFPQLAVLVPYIQLTTSKTQPTMVDIQSEEQGPQALRIFPTSPKSRP